MNPYKQIEKKILLELQPIIESVKFYYENGYQKKGNNELNIRLEAELIEAFPDKTKEAIEKMLFQGLYTQGGTSNIGYPALILQRAYKSFLIQGSAEFGYYLTVRFDTLSLDGGYHLIFLGIVSYILEDFLTSKGWLLETESTLQVQDHKGDISDWRDVGLAFKIKKIIHL